MANSEGTFGGNGSVNWRIDVHNPIKVVSRTPGPKSTLRHVGHEAAPENGRFTITIKLPKDEKHRDRFLSRCRSAVAKVKNGRLTLKLPIEAGNRNQIRIRWPSGDRGRKKR